MPAGVFRKDLEGRYVFVNSWFCRIKRIKSDQILGRTIQQLAAGEVSQFNPSASEAVRVTQAAVQSAGHHEAIIKNGKRIELVEEYLDADGKVQYLRAVKSPVFDSGGRIAGSQGILFDITDSKESEAKLEKVHRQLLEISRQAGMAEIATNVLHNVGNVLNSVNVSAGLVADSIKKSRITNLARIVALLREHGNDLGRFITTDPNGKHVPAYLAQLSDQLQGDREATVRELDSLRRNVEHIKEIVAMQQSYAKVGGVKELVDLKNLVEDGLRMNESGLNRHQVEVVREYEDVPPLNLEKHKVLQILVNLLRNAKYACDESTRADKRLTVRIADAAGRVRVSVIDNGVGIPPENLTRIFNHGFTTRKGGHGFGLHSGALAAREMGGSLVAQSDGPGLGATFTLELPYSATKDPHE
jgi:PAS domain S-box-containing protein